MKGQSRVDCPKCRIVPAFLLTLLDPSTQAPKKVTSGKRSSRTGKSHIFWNGPVPASQCTRAARARHLRERSASIIPAFNNLAWLLRRVSGIELPNSLAHYARRSEALCPRPLAAKIGAF